MRPDVSKEASVRKPLLRLAPSARLALMALLRFDNVTKAYPGSAPALSEVSFSVEEGEMLFVTGH